MTRPNIVLIHSDQHRYDCLGAIGHPLVRTPHLDTLAQQGTQFTQAYCPAPICSPSRSSLMCGQWPVTHGCISNGNTEAFRPMLDGLPTFSQTLRSEGYQLAYAGKWGLPGSPLDLGFHHFQPGSAYAQWRKSQGLAPPPRSNGFFGETDPYIRPEQSSLAWGADRAIELLRQMAPSAQRGQSPFFLRWDPAEPHPPCCPPEPFASMYAPKSVAPWPSFPDPLTNKPYIQGQQRKSWLIEDWTWEEWAPVVARYLGVLSLLDEQVGRVLQVLDELNLAQDTLVLYSSDHGDLCGAHGMMDKHFVMYDDVVRVPLLARWPGRLPAGARCDRFVSAQIDLARTFCDAAGAAAPPSFAGTGLMTTLGAETPLREDIFSMYHGCQMGLYSQRMVRNRRWKYIWNPTAEDELYDLENDPGEIHNQASSVLRGEELEGLRGRMLHWMRQVNDRLLNQWTLVQLEHGLKQTNPRRPAGH